MSEPAAERADHRAGPDPARRREVRIVATVAVGITATIVVWWLFLRLRSLLLLLLVAFFVSLATEPPVGALARRGWPRGLATAAVYLAAVVLLTAFAATIGSLAVSQVGSMASGVPDTIDRIAAFLNQRFGTDISTEGLFGRLSDEDNPIRQAMSSLASSALNLGASAVGLIFNLLAIGLFSFYLAADGPRFRRSVCSLMPPSIQREVLRAWNIAIDRTAGYLYSRGLLAAASAIAHGGFMTVIGVPYGAALGLWVGVASQFVPTVGTYLAGLLPVIVALANDPVDVLWLVAFMVVYQSFENYVLAPPLTARSLRIHPAVAFASVIAGAAILGPAGAILALPATASIQAFASAYVRSYEVVSGPLTADVRPPQPGRDPGRDRG
jgi:predicted PurR-regulated permease PerM